MAVEQSAPSPERILDTAFAFERSYALKGAVEVDIFTAIAEGNQTAQAIAKSRGLSQRATRILCDFLTTCGFLQKTGERYRLAEDSAMFLDRRKPAYIGSILEFIVHPLHTQPAMDTAEIVRTGTLPAGRGVTEPDHPIWRVFARNMAPLLASMAQLTAQHAKLDPEKPAKILDIAAGHGEFGIAIARRFPRAHIVGQDWPSVLPLARERAQNAQCGDRFTELPGDAFEVDFGDGYDLVLLPNFLHHFDEPANTALLKKVHRALRPGGQVIVVEFVPNEDRTTPPFPARFAYTMLITTPSGDAYTFPDLNRMLAEAGFSRIEQHPLEPTPQTAVVAFA